MSNSEAALEARARRAAQRVGLMAKKSNWRRGTFENYGGFMLIDPSINVPVAGFQFDLASEAVIDYCSE